MLSALLLTALSQLATPDAGVAPSPPAVSGLALKAKLTEARNLSVAEKYAEAADLLGEVLDSGAPPAPLNEDVWKQAASARAEYRLRDTAARAGAKPAELRLLLKSLLTPGSSSVEKAAPSDPRITTRFETLLKVDPVLAKVAGKRTWKLAMTATGIDGDAEKALTEGLVSALAPLGITVTTTAGQDVLSLSVRAGEVIEAGKAAPGAPGSLPSLFPADALSCGVTVTGSLARGGATVLPRLDFSARGISFTQANCRLDPSKKSAARAPLAVLLAMLDAK